MTELRDVAILDPDTALERQTAELVRHERQLHADLDRFFTKYQELQQRHGQAGTDWGRRFDPVIKAAYDAWRTRDHGDIPLMTMFEDTEP